MNETSGVPLRLLDTSVLVRYFVRDVPDQAARASALIESDRPIGLTAIALLETAYVLTRHYGYARESVVNALVELLTRENVEGVGVDRLRAAAILALCRPSGAVSFGDALLAASGLSAGVAEAYTFDRGLRRTGLATFIV